MKSHSVVFIGLALIACELLWKCTYPGKHSNCKKHCFIWCLYTVYICAHRPCHYYHQKKTGTGSRALPLNNHTSRVDHQPTEVLFKNHLFLVSRQVLGTTTRSSHRVSHQPHCGQPLHWGILDQGHQHSWRAFKNMEEICRWHFCVHRVCSERSIPEAHQQGGPTYPVYNRRCQSRWVHSLP